MWDLAGQSMTVDQSTSVWYETEISSYLSGTSVNVWATTWPLARDVVVWRGSVDSPADRIRPKRSGKETRGPKGTRSKPLFVETMRRLKLRLDSFLAKVSRLARNRSGRKDAPPLTSP